MDLAAKREREQQKQQQQEQQAAQQQQQQQQREQVQQQAAAQQQQAQTQQTQKQHFDLPLMDHKLTDFLRANIENLEGLGASNKDLLALHNGAWATSNNVSSSSEEKRLSEGGQEKIVRAFSEVMKNMQRMKTYVRPAMCKPYGKQSEALQKSK